jgi:hypothetical protein
MNRKETLSVMADAARIAELEAERDKAPSGSNADEWRLFLDENKDFPDYVAVHIAEAIDAAVLAERERIARRFDTMVTSPMAPADVARLVREEYAPS